MTDNFVQTDLIWGIISRLEIEKFLTLPKYKHFIPEGLVLISITDPDSTSLSETLINNELSIFKDILEIKFWDLEEPIGRFVTINNSQGNQIRDFILNNRDNRFVVHCAAGVSRSAGVGLAIECLIKYNGDRYKFSQYPSKIKNHWRYSPNLVVLDKVCPK